MFENWVLLELMKKDLACDAGRSFYFWRDQSGMEVDFLVEAENGFDVIECKSGQTQASDWFTTLTAWTEKTQAKPLSCNLVYGGNDSVIRQGVHVFGWQVCSDIIASF